MPSIFRTFVSIKTKLLLVLAWLIFCHTFFSRNYSEEVNKQKLEVDTTTAKEIQDLSLPLHQNPHYEDFTFSASKKILYFNNYFDHLDWNFGFGHGPFVKFGCPVTNCYVTNNRDLVGSMAKFDAILFHGRYMDKRVVKVPNQQKRGKKQTYVFFLMESPLNDGLNYTNKRYYDPFL